MNLHDIIKRALITEKAVGAQAIGQYAFEVDRRATKLQVRAAVERFFGVNVEQVRTSVMHGKIRRNLKFRRAALKPTPWKKAVVTIKEGQKIELFEGV